MTLIADLIADLHRIATEMETALAPSKPEPTQQEPTEWRTQQAYPFFLTFDSYQRQAATTAQYPRIGANIFYPTLGLCGEAGEVAEKIKKVMRDKNGLIDDDTKEAIKKELGDVLWYLAQLSTELGLSLSDVAAHNLQKLKDRKERNKIKGDGDTR